MNSHVSNSLRVGSKLNDYRIQSILGRGAFGITYLAYDTNLQQLVAIKEYLPQELAKRNEDNTVHPLTKNREKIFNYGLSSFLREARTIAKFRHPNIIRIFSYFSYNNTAYIVMEYEKGQTFKTYITTGGDVSESRLLDIFHSINKGLEVVHKYKEEDTGTSHYIHRDIKPDNIIIREDNSPVLIDFGTARDVSTSEEITRIFTKYYAPFEQCDPSWAAQGPWTDIYALGATLYFAITNNRVPPAETRTFNDRYQALEGSDYTKKYSSHFLYAIDKALSFHPNDRPRDVIEWDNALKSNIYNIETTNTSLPRRPNSPPIIDNKILEEKKPPKEKESRAKVGKNTFIIIGLFSLIAIGIYSFSNFNNQLEDRLGENTEEINTSNKSVKLELQDNSDKNQEDKSSSSIKDLPRKLSVFIDSMQDRLKNKDIPFSDLVDMLDRVNNEMNGNFYKEVRLLYLNIMQRIIDTIPSSIKKEHDNWLYQHRNNIDIKNNNKYEILNNVKNEILENKVLYGSLVIKSSLIKLTVSISGDNSICTLSNPCTTPITQGRIQAGQKTIKFNNDQENIHINDTINIHPNQDYILHLNVK